MPKVLQNKRILVTRAEDQNSALSRQLAALGAIPVELPTIQIVPAADPAPLDAALARLNTYHWLVFTSANGVKYFWQHFLNTGRDKKYLQRLHIAAIGPATAKCLTELGLEADLIPPAHIAEAFLAAFPAVKNQRILLPSADIARPTLPDGLRAKGAIVDQVTVYQTKAAPAPPDLATKLTGLDVITFTSSSTATNLMAMVPAQPIKSTLKSEINAGHQRNKLIESDLIEKIRQTTIACIGPKTAQTIHELGWPVHIEATEHTTSGLVSALAAYYRP